MALDLSLRVNEFASMPVQTEDTTGKLANWQIENLLDFFGGQDDIKNKIIRAVGNPIERFREDGLRGMRACRLACVLGFDIEENTLNGIKETLEVADLVSKERIQVELVKLIEDSPKPSIGIELMRKCGLLELYIPELLEGYGMEHNQYHVHDIYQHSLDTVDIAPKEIRFAALFHDIGKPRCKDGETFYGHDRVGAEMTREILRRLKFSNEFIDKTVRLVREHMFFYPHKEEIAETQQKEIRDQAFKDGWSDAAIRRLIQRVGGDDNLDNLIKLRVADASSNPKSAFNPNRDGLHALIERVSEVRQQDSLISVRDLKITGNDLIELGITAGPKIKEILEYLLEEVTEDIELNEKEKLLELARIYINSL
jgi:poly(A) polymerase/tRNA nucleotidyltransferase (CCA-adding enzyme)